MIAQACAPESGESFGSFGALTLANHIRFTAAGAGACRGQIVLEANASHVGSSADQECCSGRCAASELFAR
jgi:hypothetical protein